MNPELPLTTALVAYLCGTASREITIRRLQALGCPQSLIADVEAGRLRPQGTEG